MAQLLVNVDVGDLEAAVRFYGDAFGLSVGRRFGTAAAELLGAQAPIYLLAKKVGSTPFDGATAARAYERHWTPVHLDFAVADIAAAVQRARGAGARQEGEIREETWGKMALLSDPFGHGVCLLQFTGRGYDEVATAGGTRSGEARLFPEDLATPRLRLRRPRFDDTGAIFTRYASDPEVTRYMSFPTHRTREDTLAFLAHAEQGWHSGRDAAYLIFRRSDGVFLGATGLTVETPHRYCTGYVLARDAWGQGYASETLAAMLALAFSHPAVRRVYALCDAEHKASARVMEKCGMQQEGVLRRHMVLPNLSPEPRDMLCFARVRE